MSLLPRHCRRCGKSIPGNGVHDCDESRAESELWAALRGLGTVTFGRAELTKLCSHEDEGIAHTAKEALAEYDKLWTEKLPDLEKRYGHLAGFKPLLDRVRKDLEGVWKP